ncbi:hypothetical protein VFPPC_15598 [Pochonia chlamydosporia 170]|uniref:Uncharacterized protein n=1 Tax=Pochonia chlamydosporia 170 TaxID=1380566 RepID=A0A179FY75_METCM|nr:hypothetical protein VFPPC_15598 [Pochonia chlamydosporia 170]OAQ70594.1 hypothetical protein VFPPC_15598 [Pochonia chlamydosporia 170]
MAVSSAVLLRSPFRTSIWTGWMGIEIPNLHPNISGQWTHNPIAQARPNRPHDEDVARPGRNAPPSLPERPWRTHFNHSHDRHHTPCSMMAASSVAIHSFKCGSTLQVERERAVRHESHPS